MPGLSQLMFQGIISQRQQVERNTNVSLKPIIYQNCVSLGFVFLMTPIFKEKSPSRSNLRYNGKNLGKQELLSQDKPIRVYLLLECNEM